MIINPIWRYRELYGYHLLISMHNSEILTLNENTADIFKNENDDINKTLREWKKLKHVEDETCKQLLNYFLKKGILINEEV